MNIVNEYAGTNGVFRPPTGKLPLGADAQAFADAGLPYFAVCKVSDGYAHRNIGAPQSWIVGFNQTCHWYKYKTDAEAAAKRFNDAHRIKNPAII